MCRRVYTIRWRLVLECSVALILHNCSRSDATRAHSRRSVFRAGVTHLALACPARLTARSVRLRPSSIVKAYIRHMRMLAFAGFRARILHTKRKTARSSCFVRHGNAACRYQLSLAVAMVVHTSRHHYRHRRLCVCIYGCNRMISVRRFYALALQVYLLRWEIILSPFPETKNRGVYVQNACAQSEPKQNVC